jgi:hypothetical protein
MLAALRHEGLIRTSEGSLRSYERLDQLGASAKCESW